MRVTTLFLASTLTLIGACDSTGPSAQNSADETVKVSPGQQTGTLLVSIATGASLPDWSGGASVGFGYNPTTYHVLTTSNVSVSSGTIGSPIKLPHGTYKVVLNDTLTTVSITAQQQTQVGASRIEVADVSGSFTLSANSGTNTWSGYPILDATFPTGVGINVFAGDFEANVSYQSAQKQLSAKCDAGSTALVQPADLRGNLVVVAPTASLPDWSGGSSIGFGYSNSVLHVLTQANVSVTSGNLGDSLALPEGNYKIVLNDTVMPVSVTRQQTTTVYGGRIEVDNTDVSGSYTISAVSPTATWSGYPILDATLPLGVGLNVLPGSYQVNVTYSFGGTDTFPITVDNSP
jgi:hypothetical protein